MSPRSNISLHSLKPGQEVSSQVKALYREIGRLERELELKQHEIDSYRNSNSRASKHDSFGNNGRYVFSDSYAWFTLGHRDYTWLFGAYGLQSDKVRYSTVLNVAKVPYGWKNW